RLAATLLADFGRDRPEVLARLLPEADERQHALLLSRARSQAGEVIPPLERGLGEAPAPRATDEEYDGLAPRQARGAPCPPRAGEAVSWLRLGKATGVGPLLRHRGDPAARSYLVHHLASYGVEAEAVLGRLGAEPDASARRALLLALGDYSPEQLPAAGRVQL